MLVCNFFVMLNHTHARKSKNNKNTLDRFVLKDAMALECVSIPSLRNQEKISTEKLAII